MKQKGKKEIMVYPQCQNASHKGYKSASHLGKVAESLKLQIVSSIILNTAGAIHFQIMWILGQKSIFSRWTPPSFHPTVKIFHFSLLLHKEFSTLFESNIFINIHLLRASLLCQYYQVQRCARARRKILILSFISVLENAVRTKI